VAETLSVPVINRCVNQRLVDSLVGRAAVLGQTVFGHNYPNKPGSLDEGSRTMKAFGNLLTAGVIATIIPCAETRAASVRAVGADDFVEFIGVQTHLWRGTI
jgi:hypothetical protein